MRTKTIRSSCSRITWDSPRGFYGESYIDPDLWEWLDLDDHDRELLAVYQDHVDENGTIDQARDAFAGRADSPEDWAAEWLEETGEIAEIPERLRGYFDYAAYARATAALTA